MKTPKVNTDEQLQFKFISNTRCNMKTYYKGTLMIQHTLQNTKVKDYKDYKHVQCNITEKPTAMHHTNSLSSFFFLLSNDVAYSEQSRSGCSTGRQSILIQSIQLSNSLSNLNQNYEDSVYPTAYPTKTKNCDDSVYPTAYPTKTKTLHFFLPLCKDDK
jgi:hypothetical protein